MTRALLFKITRADGAPLGSPPIYRRGRRYRRHRPGSPLPGKPFDRPKVGGQPGAWSRRIPEGRLSAGTGYSLFTLRGIVNEIEETASVRRAGRYRLINGSRMRLIWHGEEAKVWLVEARGYGGAYRHRPLRRGSKGKKSPRSQQRGEITFWSQIRLVKDVTGYMVFYLTGPVAEAESRQEQHEKLCEQGARDVEALEDKYRRIEWAFCDATELASKRGKQHAYNAIKSALTGGRFGH